MILGFPANHPSKQRLSSQYQDVAEKLPVYKLLEAYPSHVKIASEYLDASDYLYHLQQSMLYSLLPSIYIEIY
jgi:hypothetical protein